MAGAKVPEQVKNSLGPRRLRQDRQAVGVRKWRETIHPEQFPGFWLG